MNKLLAVQSALKAPKNQLNKFGGYNYRSCEDILEALKPLLAEHGCTLWIDDEMVAVGNRVYVKATATFIDGDMKTVAHGWAREEEVKKGMDSSQITGAASSYARKYALNGLFLIDDSKDSDHTNNNEEKPASKPAQAPATTSKSKSLTHDGYIESSKVENGWTKVVIGGIEVATKKEDLVKKLIEAEKLEAAIMVKYTEVVNGRFTNRYIESIAILEDTKEEHPF